MPVVIRKGRQLGNVSKHWNNEGRRFTGTYHKSMTTKAHQDMKLRTCFSDTNEVAIL